MEFLQKVAAFMAKWTPAVVALAAEGGFVPRAVKAADIRAELSRRGVRLES